MEHWYTKYNGIINESDVFNDKWAILKNQLRKQLQELNHDEIYLGTDESESDKIDGQIKQLHIVLDLIKTIEGI